MFNYLPVINTTQSEKKVKNIRQLIKKNRISCLTHFTHIDNLRSILEFGILPLSILESNKTFANVRKTSVSLPREWHGLVPLNISFPDYKLFNQMQNHQSSEWVVLLIDPAILYNFPCYFFPDRASEFIGFAPQAGLPLGEYQTSGALKDLFADTETVKRRELEIPSFYTTNPCSEVLSFFPIAPSSITQVFFASDYKFNMWVLSNTDFAVSRVRNLWNCGLQFHSPRTDYTFWKRIGAGTGS
ncbi:MAG: DUF4433 domain-containing protein [Anaerolineaceae bacterium]|nr:DUF4433 domain-containing protein [Anaerolineaceae bacterium]